MLIVLEGCDGSGKTTLANKLAYILGAQIIHCTTDTPNDWNYFSAIISMSENRNIIADRFCYGQFVYQDPVERHLDEDALRGLEMRMDQCDARVIYVDAPIYTLQQRLDERNETPIKPLHILKEKYEKVWERSLLPITRIDTSEFTL